MQKYLDPNSFKITSIERKKLLYLNVHQQLQYVLALGLNRHKFMDKFSCAEGILCTFKVCAIKKEWLFINHNMVGEANFQKSNNEIFEL